jgi:Kef-type K+ transport system membrane component KefB
LEIITEILVLLVFARVMGEGAERIGMPATVGELVAGILLAALVAVIGADMPILQHVATSEALQYIANAGIFFLVLMAGIELKPEEIVQHSLRSFGVALGGAILPLTLGFAFAWAFLPDSDLKLGQAMLVGIAMSITALPVSVKVLSDFGVLRTPLGETIVAAAIFDDVIGLFLLAVLTAVIQTGHIPDIGSFAIIIGKVCLFFAVAIGLGVHVYPRVSAHVKALKATALEFSILMAIALGYALLAEFLGMHWILGAFVAGLYFEPRWVGDQAYQEMTLIVTGVTSGFLAPLFLASIGLQVDLSVVMAIPGFLGLLIVIASLGKFLGAGLPAAMFGLNPHEATVIGVGMNARGAVELVVLSIAANAGLFPSDNNGDPIVANLFSALVIMAVVTTLVTPVLLRLLLSAPSR